jgi:hypothetical protein
LKLGKFPGSEREIISHSIYSCNSFYPELLL